MRKNATKGLKMVLFMIAAALLFTSVHAINTGTLIYFNILAGEMPPNIYLHNPIDGENISSSYANFNWTASDGIDPTLNCGIMLDGTVNATGISAPNNTATNYTIYGLIDGMHAWNITCWTDSNQANTSETRQFRIDTTPPTITTYSPQETNYSNPTLTLNLTANDTGTGVSTIWYNWNGTNYTYTGVENITFPEGTTTIYIWANDTLGNTNYTNITFTVDTTPPQIQFVTPTPLNGTYNTSQTINVTASDTGLGLANITITVNGTVVKTCGSSPCDYALTQDGIYTFNATAYDAAGNKNSTETRTIVIDTTPPQIQFVSPTPSNGTYNTTQTINVTASDANLSTIVIYVNGTLTQTCYSSPCNYTLPGEGNYTVYATANDTAGNTNTTTPINIIIDLTPPAVQFVAPTPNNGSYSTPQTINVTASDGLAGLANITIYVNNVPVKTCGTSPCTYNLTSDGNYTIYAVAYDNAGNSNSTETRNIIINSQPPTIQYVTPTPANGTYNTSQTINVTSPDADLANITITVNGTAVQTCYSSPCNYTLTNEGTYTFNATAYDTSGNKNSTTTRTITIDKTPPQIQFVSPTPPNGTYNTTQTINVTASDGLAGLANITIYVNGTPVKTCGTSPCTYNLTSDGNYTTYSVAYDNAGNSNSTENRSIIIDKTPPQIQYVTPTPANGTYNTTQTINVTALDTLAGISNITIYINGTAATTCNAAQCNHTLADEGNYTIYASAYDNAGNRNTTETRNIIIDKTPPQIQFVSPTPANGTYTSAQMINVTASDTLAGLANITIYVNNVPVKTCAASPCTYNLTSDGNYTFYATAYDNAGNSNTSETRNILISTTPPTIQYVTPTPANGTYNTSQTINVTAADSNLANITITVNGTAVAVCGSSPCNYTITQDGTYTFYATANDTSGNSNSTTPRTIIIDKTPPAVQFVVPTPNNGSYNTSQTINVTASDALTGLANITIYVNGTVVKTCGSSPCDYTLTNEGNYTFYAVAYDTTGNRNTTETRNIVIDKTAPRFLTTGVSPYAIINGSNVSLYVNSTGFDYLWATVTRPDGSKENVTLTNDANTIYMNTSLLGRYNVTFYAADIAGNMEVREDYFEAFRGLLLDLNVTNSSIIGINSTFISYYRNGTVALNQSAIGHYVIYVPNTTLDLEFYAYSNRIIVTTYNIDIMDAAGKYVGMDIRFNYDGFLVTYGAEPQWAVTSGKVRIKYDNLNYTNEDNLRLYKCDDFNFTAMTCTGTWNDVTSLATQDKPQDYFEIYVTGFSGFSIKELIPPTECVGCGGGGGGGGEDEKACVEDWMCTPWYGCINNKQVRNCYDLSGCGTDYNKPRMMQTCYIPCYAKWNCTEWSACAPSGEQARSCSDTAKCGTRRGMPATQQGCGYDFCHDSLQDNNESGVDCGGICEECKREERPSIFEYAESNILCTLVPLLVVLLLVMIILIRGSNIEKRTEKVMVIINVMMMTLLLLTLLPIFGFSHGACMALADTMPILDEILLFLIVTFVVMLLEAMIYLLLREKKEEKKDEMKEKEKEDNKEREKEKEKEKEEEEKKEKEKDREKEKEKKKAKGPGAIKKAWRRLKHNIQEAKEERRRRKELKRHRKEQEMRNRYTLHMRKETARIIKRTGREEEKAIIDLGNKIEEEEYKTARLNRSLAETAKKIETVREYRTYLAKGLKELEDNYKFMKNRLLKRLPDETIEKSQKRIRRILDGTEQIRYKIEQLDRELKQLYEKRDLLRQEQAQTLREISHDKNISNKAIHELKKIQRQQNR